MLLWLVLIGVVVQSLTVLGADTDAEGLHGFDDDSEVRTFINKVVLLTLRSHPQNLVILDFGRCVDAGLRKTFHASFVGTEVVMESMLVPSDDIYHRTTPPGASYLAFSCIEKRPLVSKIDCSQLVPIWAALRRLAPPSNSLLYFHLWAYKDIKSVSRVTFERCTESNYLPPFVEVYAMFNSNGSRPEPVLQTAHDPEGLMYSKILGLYIGTGPRRVRTTSVEYVVGLLRRQAHLQVEHIGLFPALSVRTLPGTLIILRDELPPPLNRTLSIRFMHRRFGFSIQSHLWPVMQSPLVAVARVPATSRSAQVVYAVFEPSIWTAILATVLPIHLGLLHKQPSDLRSVADTLFVLVTSVWASVTLPQAPSSRTAFLVGLWILNLQVIGVYFRSSIVASLQSLPDDRVKIVQCRSFPRSVSARNIGKLANPVEEKFVVDDLPHFIGGGVLCQEQQKVDALRFRLLHRFDTYEVALQSLQYETISLFPDSVRIVHSDRSLISYKFYGQYPHPYWALALKISQIELSVGLIRPQRQQPMYNRLARALDAYLRRKLHPQYLTRQCKRMPIGGGKYSSRRCVTFQEIAGDRKNHLTVSVDDIHTLNVLITLGLAIATLVAIFEIIPICSHVL